jgi:predicted XRE-type DNA-binding protein
MIQFMKPLTFLGNSLKCLRDMPVDVRHDAGFQLGKVQNGQQPDDFKPMPAIGAGVEEMEDIRRNRNQSRHLFRAAPASGFRFAYLPEKDPGDAASRYLAGKGPLPRIDEGSKMNETQTFASVWDAVADTPAEAANLRARAELMLEIANIVKESGWTQAEAAVKCGVTQPRINDLLRGRVSRFSLDALVNIATALGRRVHVQIGAG